MRAKEKLNIVYILSEKSSGSSFLFRSLADALNIKDYPETQHFESETLYWTKAASILEMPQLKMLASSVPYSKERANSDLIKFLERNLGSLPPYTNDKELIFRGWYEIIQKFGPVFIEKSPHHLMQQSVLQLMKEFEHEYADLLNCHYVCIVRNPKDVFLSQFRRWNVALDTLENQWLVNYMNWFNFSKDQVERCRLIKYEDLVSDQAEIVRAICEDLGVESKFVQKEKSRKSKASKQSSFFGHTFSDSIFQLASMLGYSKHEIEGQANLKWTAYHLYTRYIYSPAKRIYNNIRGI